MGKGREEKNRKEKQPAKPAACPDGAALRPPAKPVVRPTCMAGVGRINIKWEQKEKEHQMRTGIRGEKAGSSVSV